MILFFNTFGSFSSVDYMALLPDRKIGAVLLHEADRLFLLARSKLHLEHVNDN